MALSLPERIHCAEPGWVPSEVMDLVELLETSEGLNHSPSPLLSKLSEFVMSDAAELVPTLSTRPPEQRLAS